MKLDVIMVPNEVRSAEFAERTVVVVDVLRATSTMVEALAAGAKAIYPVASIEEALRLVKTFGREEALLCGERRCLPIEGFDLGNSPGEFTAERVAGRTLVMSTTNGTAATAFASGAGRVLVASWLNLSAVVEHLVDTDAEPIFLCAGREGRFGLEDAVCAGTMMLRLTAARTGAWKFNDGALAARELARVPAFADPVVLLPATEAGQTLAAAGLAEDLSFCAQVDRHRGVPLLQDRHLILPPEQPAPTGR